MSMGADFRPEIISSAPCIQLFRRHRLLPILPYIGDTPPPLQVEFELLCIDRLTDTVVIRGGMFVIRF